MRIATLLMTAFLLAASAAAADEKIVYSDGETEMHGRLYLPADAEAPVPGVLVIHEWWGQNEHARNSAEKLSELGYAALAVDMYGQGRVADHPRDAGEMAGQVRENAGRMERRFDAALEVLRGHDAVDAGRIAAIGYCFGGSVVLEMARRGRDLAGVASFHGGLSTDHPAGSGEIRAEILVLTGAADPMVPAEQVAAFEQEMEAADAEFEVVSYDGATHSFTNPSADAVGEEYDMPVAYDAEADADAWRRLEAFLARVFAED